MKYIPEIVYSASAKKEIEQKKSRQQMARAFVFYSDICTAIFSSKYGVNTATLYYIK